MRMVMIMVMDLVVGPVSSVFSLILINSHQPIRSSLSCDRCQPSSKCYQVLPVNPKSPIMMCITVKAAGLNNSLCNLLMMAKLLCCYLHCALHVPSQNQLINVNWNMTVWGWSWSRISLSTETRQRPGAFWESLW